MASREDKPDENLKAIGELALKPQLPQNVRAGWKGSGRAAGGTGFLAALLLLVPPLLAGRLAVRA